MVQSLHEISTKALMQRIADELEGLIVADAEGRYAYVNQRWSSLTGYTFEQVKGRYVRDVVRLSRVDEVLKTQKFVSGDAILLNSQTGYRSIAPTHRCFTKTSWRVVSSI